jgi:HlyD family secretion protein
MTATVDFYVEQRNNVLMIPNSALRFQPTEQMKADYLARLQKEQEKLPDSLKQKNQSFGNNQGMQNKGSGPGGSGNKLRGTFWYVDENGNPTMGFTQLGLSDGKNTEIIKSRILKEGMQVITGFEIVGDTKSTQNSNLLNPNQNMPRGSRRGF